MKSFILILSLFLASAIYAADQPKETCGGSTCCAEKKADCCNDHCTVSESKDSKSCCTNDTPCCKDTSCCEKDADGNMKCSEHHHGSHSH
jgi:hypothetical protein